VYERLGDVRSRAITQGKIADILQSRGELEEALRIRREEQMPVYERLGDVRSRAVTQSKIADILDAKGDREAAIRIYREDVMPVYERLGDLRLLLVDRTNLAIKLAQRGHPEDHPEIRTLLTQALADAERLRLPEAQTIRGWIAQISGGGDDTAPPP
jgi:tetratricopeptide (TPR) repeat protein